MSKNLKNSKIKLEKKERIDYMFHGEILMDKIVKLLVQLVSVFAGIDIKSILLIILKQEKYIVVKR